MKGWNKNPGKTLFSLASLFFVCLVLTGICLASGGEGADRTGDLIDLGKRFMNFALLVIILYWAIKKSGVKEFFTSRTKEIGQRLQDLEKEKTEAEGKYRDAEKRLKEFDAKRVEILQEFKAEGETEKERIIAEAQERVRKIIEQAELTIQHEIQSAKARLKADIVDRAAEKARELISKEMTDKDQDHLVDEFIERVRKIH